MPFKLPENIQETSTTTGTGTLTLAGAVTGHFAFSSQMSNGDTTFYAISDGVDLEVGVGTYSNTSGQQLARNSILYSTNGGSPVNWATGTRNVFVGLPGNAIKAFLDPGLGNGLLVQDAAYSFLRRSIAAGTDISVANGSGVAGNPTVSLGFTVTAAAKTLLDDASVAAMRATLAAAGLADVNVFTAANTFNAAVTFGTPPTSTGGPMSLFDVQVFTTPGAATWTKPAGCSAVEVWCVGGGGGGSGTNNNSVAGPYVVHGMAGGGGGSVYDFITSGLGATESVTVGAGGTAGVGASSSNGGSGGQSIFGAHCTANGGAGGTHANASASGDMFYQTPPASGGSASGGLINLPGNRGEYNPPGVFGVLQRGATTYRWLHRYARGGSSQFFPMHAGLSNEGFELNYDGTQQGGTTPSVFNSSFGHGGYSGFSYNQNTTTSAHTSNGMAGNPGIVIVKSYR